MPWWAIPCETLQFPARLNKFPVRRASLSPAGADTLLDWCEDVRRSKSMLSGIAVGSLFRSHIDITKSPRSFYC
jgi:hypothetical protein